MVSRTKKHIGRLCLAYFPISTCLFPLVREVLYDRGKSLWKPLGVWTSARYEENQSLLSRKGYKRNFSSLLYPLRNLFERINEHIPQRQRNINTDKVCSKNKLRNTANLACFLQGSDKSFNIKGKRRC